MNYILKTWVDASNNVTLGKTYKHLGNAHVGFKFEDDIGRIRSTTHGTWTWTQLCKEVKGVQPSNTFLDDIVQNTKELAKADTIEVRNENVGNSVRGSNYGNSDYSRHKIQPWDIWLEYNLNPWDADIIKRTLRTKHDVGMTKADQRALDYNKIIHICQERIRQLEK